MTLVVGRLRYMGDYELGARGGWGWILNPMFLSMEILFIDFILSKWFFIETCSIVGSFVLFVFATIYSWFDFSSQTKLQIYIICVAAISELGILSSKLLIDRTLIQLSLCAAILVCGAFHILVLRVRVIDGSIHARSMFKANKFNPENTTVEIREPGISIIMKTGDLILRDDNFEIRLSGLKNPYLIRRGLIDKFGVSPHFQKATWAGTLWIFLLIVIVIVAIECYLFILIYQAMPANGVTQSIGSLAVWFIANMCILNVRIPRYPNDPANDLRHQTKIAEGMWTEIFHEKDGWVTKQLFRCGWGHNDYTEHRVPVIGSKICGKWNPLVLVIIHSTMLIYQMVGVKRRIVYQDFIRALPKTKLEVGAPYRYSQQWVENGFVSENMPQDVHSQMSDLQEDLSRVGLFIDDMHAGNFRIDQDSRIQAIDGELYTDGEVFVKSLLVRLVDGHRVEGMSPVLGYDRIVRWVDHRTSVDDILR